MMIPAAASPMWNFVPESTDTEVLVSKEPWRSSSAEAKPVRFVCGHHFFTRCRFQTGSHCTAIHQERGLVSGTEHVGMGCKAGDII